MIALAYEDGSLQIGCVYVGAGRGGGGRGWGGATSMNIFMKICRVHIYACVHFDMNILPRCACTYSYLNMLLSREPYI